MLDYCRRARALRWRLRDQPLRLHRSLGKLAIGPTAKAVPTERAVAQWYLDYVTRKMEDPVLRYSLRLELLATAAKVGIGRFEANLLIAVVQQQMDAPKPRASYVIPAWILAATIVLLEAAALVWLLA